MDIDYRAARAIPIDMWHDHQLVVAMQLVDGDGIDYLIREYNARSTNKKLKKYKPKTNLIPWDSAVFIRGKTTKARRRARSYVSGHMGTKLKESRYGGELAFAYDVETFLYGASWSGGV